MGAKICNSYCGLLASFRSDRSEYSMIKPLYGSRILALLLLATVCHEKIALAQGFGMEDAQSMSNHLTWGLDGWLYGVNGSTTTCHIRDIEFQQGVWRYHPKTISPGSAQSTGSPPRSGNQPPGTKTLGQHWPRHQRGKTGHHAAIQQRPEGHQWKPYSRKSVVHEALRNLPPTPR
jgi:hypothetical protein